MALVRRWSRLFLGPQVVLAMLTAMLGGSGFTCGFPYNLKPPVVLNSADASKPGGASFFNYFCVHALVCIRLKDLLP